MFFGHKVNIYNQYLSDIKVLIRFLPSVKFILVPTIDIVVDDVKKKLHNLIIIKGIVYFHYIIIYRRRLHITKLTARLFEYLFIIKSI